MAANMVLSTRNTYEQNAIQVNQLVLRHAVDNIGNSLDAINPFIEQLYTNTALNTFMNKAYKKKVTADEIIPVISSLNSLYDNNGIVENYMIYSPTNSMMISPTQGFLNVSRYYNKNYFYYGDYTYEDWKALLLSGCRETSVMPSTNNIFAGKSRKSIQLITPYINYSTGQSLGCIVINLNSNRISEMLNSAHSYVTSFYSVWDEDQQVILSPDNEIGTLMQSVASDISVNNSYNITKESIQIAKLNSKICNWTVALAIDNNAIIRKSWKDTKTTIFMAVFLFMIGLSVTGWLLLLNRRPLSNIVSQLNSNIKLTRPTFLRNGLWQLSSAISELSKNHRELENIHYEQKLQLKNLIISRLTNGDISDEQNIEKALSELGIDIQLNYFCGIYMRVISNHMNEDAIVRIILNLKQYYQLTFLSQVDKCTFQLILSFEEVTNFKHEVNQIFSALHEWLKDTYGLESRFCAGFPCKNLSKLHHSFSTAKLLLDIEDDGRFILVREEEPKSITEYTYTPQHKQEFIKYLNSGMSKEVSELLHSIYELNFDEKHISFFSRKLLYSAIIDTIIKSNNPISLNDEFCYTFFEYPPVQFFELISKHCIKICELQQKQYLQECNELTQNILKYIKENIGDYNMSLSHLSMKFGMTEKYISFYIKEHAGVNFLTYLEKLRMEEANRLLLTALNVTEIASRVGYINVNSFRRCYRRNQGVSPSEFRELMQH